MKLFFLSSNRVSSRLAGNTLWGFEHRGRKATGEVNCCALWQRSMQNCTHSSQEVASASMSPWYGAGAPERAMSVDSDGSWALTSLLSLLRQALLPSSLLPTTLSESLKQVQQRLLYRLHKGMSHEPDA